MSAILKAIKLFLSAAFLIAAIVFVYSSIQLMKPAIKEYPLDNDTTVYRPDTDDSNKGNYVLSYAIIGGCCFLSAAILLHSVKDK